MKKSPTDFTVNNHNISNPVEIAVYFCEYFTNIGPNLSNNIDNSSCCYKSYLTDNMVNSEQVGNLSSLTKKLRAETKLHCIYIQNKARKLARSYFS